MAVISVVLRVNNIYCVQSKGEFVRFTLIKGAKRIGSVLKSGLGGGGATSEVSKSRFN